MNNRDLKTGAWKHVLLVVSVMAFGTARLAAA